MKKFSNKILIIALLTLVAIFAGSKIFLAPGRESNLDAEALAFDTAAITKIEVFPRKDDQVTLHKNDGIWKVSQHDKLVNARESSVSALLTSLAEIKPERVVSRKKENWQRYGLADTTALKISIYKGNDIPETLFVGKTSGGDTYVRKEDSDDVYAVAGYLDTKIDKDFSEWRDQTLIRLDKDLVSRIAFVYPADTGFVVEKEKSWMIGEQKADSAAVEQYLNAVRFKDHSEFADDFAPEKDADVTVTFTENGKDIVVKGWNTAFYEWVVSSSLQPDVYFKDTSMSIARSVFVGRKKLAGK